MGLRDWHPLHVGLMWVVGVVVLGLLVRRMTTSFSGGSATGGGMAGFSLPIGPSLIAVLLLVGLVVVTIRWMRRAG